ncbi:MAG: dihydroorotate dehydrogenase-like protein [Bacteroidales bacterium]|nr:dihydroorotate dehydrogenase-like protein [Bacteroidales bacterium]MBN2757231.1 dihydroorotate dehydrogenase-like protein [Bacteroidales bacterium]
MANLTTKYLGLELRNPLIVGSSGLTNSVEDIKDLERKGAGAIVLKSIFEEEIMLEFKSVIKEVEADENNLEYYDYFDYKIKADNIKRYIKLIEDVKKEVNIPVIASINCVTAQEWTFFAKKIQDAGADAIELNAFFLPTDCSKTSQENEKIYFDLINSVSKLVTIPVSLKISYYFSNLARMIKTLSETTVSGIVLFNRFYSPDFDIDNKKVISTHVLSSENDLPISLRWVAIMAERINCDISASTGVHDGKALIKQLLAGADSVQVVSALYKNGTSHIGTMLKELEVWMDKNGYKTIADFKGSMSQAKSNNPAAFERVQFMKYFGEMKL